MSNIPVPQARYELLKDDTKTKFVINKKVCLISTLTLLSVATAGLIILIINLEYFVNGFRLPNYYQPQEFPSQWVQRAIKYNSIAEHSYSKNHSEVTRKNYRYKNLHDYKLVCYYSIPTSNANSNDNYLSANKVDPNLCTHINVGFLIIRNNSIQVPAVANETIRNITYLKKQNKNLKVLISIGGAGDDTGFSEMVLNHLNRKTFIRSAVSLIKEFKLDGVDLDWEFPNDHKNGDKKQKIHFTQLLYEIREEIKRHTEKHRFLLSVAVAAPRMIVDNSYDVSKMNEYVDYINLMSYDFHFYTKYTPFTGLNAPLYSISKEGNFFKDLNINSSAFYWHETGMDKSKIIVGLPTYGHSFLLTNPSNTGLMAPSSGYGKIGNLGFVDYSDVCWFLSTYKIKAIFDLEAKSPYAFKGTEWISFEDIQSLTYKLAMLTILHGGFLGILLSSGETAIHPINF